MSTDYSNVIQSISNNTEQTVGRDADPKSYLEALQFMASSSMAETAKFKKLMSDSLEDQVKEYNNTSDKLTTYNQMYVNNNYINEELSTEHRQMDAMSAELKKKIYISKQKSQSYIYIANRTFFYRNIVLASVLLVLALMVVLRAGMSGLISESAMYTVMAVMCVVFAGIMSWYVIWSSYRTKHDWTKFYWSGPLPSGGGDCPNLAPTTIVQTVVASPAETTAPPTTS